jgi:hypothetical protein
LGREVLACGAYLYEAVDGRGEDLEADLGRTGWGEVRDGLVFGRAAPGEDLGGVHGGVAVVGFNPSFKAAIEG